MSLPEGEPAFEVLSSEHRYTGWAINVHTDAVRMPDGSVAKRDVIDHPGAVAIVALDDDHQVVMVSQYRHPVGHWLLELPAGLLDVDGEPAVTAAQRELLEETGLKAAEWSVLVDLYTSPGMSGEAIRLYLARGLSEVSKGAFEASGEELTMRVSRHPLPELVRQCLAGALTNGPAVAGIMALAFVRDNHWEGLRPADAPWPARPGLAGE